MNQLSEVTADVLQFFYPGVVFDAEGLTRLLLPCAAVVLVSLIVSLCLKIARPFRRFAYVPVIVALIVMIAASSFFPVSMMRAGEYAEEQIQQLVSTQEDEI